MPPMNLPPILTSVALTALVVTLLRNQSPMPPPPRTPPVPEPPAAIARGDDPNRAAVAAAALKPQLTRDLAAMGLRYGDPVFIRVFKEERLLELWVRRPDQSAFQLFRSYPVAAMSGRLGPKLAEGDWQAPEGFYFVPREQMNPASKYHLSFDLGFPNAYDASHGRTGTFLMVHGNRVSAGCYAMTDAKIEEIYTLCDAALTNGQPFFRVHCFPFRMTAERLEQARDHQWFPFWQNLKEGHDLFETHRLPPDTTVRNERYEFS